MSGAAQVSAAWAPVGLQGDTVTAIAGGQVFATDIIVAGTARGGVYARMGTAAFVSMSPPRFGAVRSMLLQSESHLLMAGADSGLYCYRFTSGVPPTWRKCTGVPSERVTAVTGRGDTLYCCSPSEVYRSVDGGNAWTACNARAGLPGLGNMTSFTSLAFWHGSINAGSRFMAALNSWDGVMQSWDAGQTWRDISMLPGQAQRVGEVYALVSYSQRFNTDLMLVAGTGAGIFYVVEVDTGEWRLLEPQLEGVRINHLDVTFQSRSMLADLFAATDSGTYLLSIAGSGKWERLSALSSYGVASWRVTDPREWYVATADGVFRYSEMPSSTLPDRRFPVPLSALQPGRAYGVDGRLLRETERMGPGVGLDVRGRTIRVVAR